MISTIIHNIPIYMLGKSFPKLLILYKSNVFSTVFCYNIRDICGIFKGLKLACLNNIFAVFNLKYIIIMVIYCLLPACKVSKQLTEPVKMSKYLQLSKIFTADKKMFIFIKFSRRQVLQYLIQISKLYLYFLIISKLKSKRVMQEL